MNNLPYNKIIIILSGIFIPLLIILIIFTYRTPKTSVVNQNIESQSNLSWNIVQSQNNKVDVFLSGSTASKVTALDLNVSFDKHIKISSVEPGEFFADPIKTKFDNKNFVYSLMTNPDSKIDNDLTKPILKFILSPASLTGYSFSILPASLVYLQDIGGSNPTASQIILK